MRYSGMSVYTWSLPMMMSRVPFVIIAWRISGRPASRWVTMWWVRCKASAATAPPATTGKPLTSRYFL